LHEGTDGQVAAASGHSEGKFDVELNGCPADAEPTIMHIHDGLKGANGGVVVNSGLVAGEWKLTAGAGRITKEIPTIGTLLVSNIRVSPNGFYFNVHTKVNAGGVVRGQLQERR